MRRAKRGSRLTRVYWGTGDLYCCEIAWPGANGNTQYCVVGVCGVVPVAAMGPVFSAGTYRRIQEGSLLLMCARSADPGRAGRSVEKDAR